MRTEKLIKGYIFEKFKEVYTDDYFEKGVTDIDMKAKAYKQSLEE